MTFRNESYRVWDSSTKRKMNAPHYYMALLKIADELQAYF